MDSKRFIDYGLPDFRLLDQTLFPLLRENELKGEHLRLLFSLAHSSVLKGQGYEVGEVDAMKAFSFLLEHKDEAVDAPFILSLYGASTGKEGKWKDRNCYFDDGKGFYVTCSKEKTEEEMLRLCDELSFLNHPKDGDFDRIYEFAMRFICIHPFLDGNGRMSAALVQELLYKAGLTCAHYLPIDPLLNGLFARATTAHIRFASGSFYGSKPLDLSRYVPYMNGIVAKAYLSMIQALQNR